jgi:hypothetical protein
MDMAPTLVASRTSLPPEGALFPLGRPGGETVALTLVACAYCAAPRGGLLGLGRPGAAAVLMRFLLAVSRHFYLHMKSQRYE